MAKKTGSITSATHRLTLEIARPQAAVWKAFTDDIQSWWPKDFYASDSPQRMIFEVKPGGRLYEDSGNGNGLVWYHVIALNAPNSITMSGFIAPPFGGPATSLLNVSFSAKDKAATVMEVTDSTFAVWKKRRRWKAGVHCLRAALSPGSSGKKIRSAKYPQSQWNDAKHSDPLLWLPGNALPDPKSQDLIYF